MTYTLTYPDGRTEIPFSQPNYNLNWQIYCDFAKPIKIPKGTKIHVDAWFDNSANNLSFAKTRPVRNLWFPVIVKTYPRIRHMFFKLDRDFQSWKARQT